MEFFRIRKDIPFMRHALVFNVISLLTFLAAVFFLATKGLHLSIEFTGGTLLEVSYTQAPDLEKIRKALEADGFADPQVQNFGSSRDVLIRVPLAKNTESAKVGDQVMASLQKLGAGDTAAGAANAPTLKRVEFVGPQVGKELAENGAMALLVVITGIMIYLAFRFEWRFSVSAIIANLHDVIIIVGVFGFAGVAVTAARLAKVLFVFGLAMFLLLLFAGRRSRQLGSNPPPPGMSRAPLLEPLPGHGQDSEQLEVEGGVG